ncbi:MAG: hypothetical protein ACRD8Z_21675 [Nitrososphaeraceae archaeon]
MALVTMAIALTLVSAIVPTTIYAQDREQGEHGSASEDFTGQPDDASHWGDETSERASSEHDIGEHSREGEAPGDAPFDGPEDDQPKGRIGIGNNNGDGPSGHGTCVDDDPDNDDALC